MEDSKFLGELFDKKLMAIISLFLENKSTQFYLREVASKCQVSPTTTYRIINRLVQLGILNVNTINRFKFYQLSDNERVKLLENLTSKDPIERFVSLIKDISGIKTMLLYGDRQPEYANIIIIGEANRDEVHRAAERVKSEFGFSVRHLSFSLEQFDQMSAMGLYPQRKKVLWKSI